MSSNILPESTAATASSVTPDNRGNRTWVIRTGDRAKTWKAAVAHHVVTHEFIRYGDSILLGSGTTPIYLMKAIVDAQITKDEAPDLAIVTSNLQVLYAVRDAQRDNAGIFGNTQVILTGGRLNNSLNSLIGDYAERAVNSDWYSPRTVFFGAAGLTFRGGLNISFQFEEEITTQIAFATRETENRVLLADHTKLGTPSFIKAKLSIESLMRRARICYVITTIDPSDPVSCAALKAEQKALEDLLTPLREKKELDEKDFVFRVIREDGSVENEVRLRNHSQAMRPSLGPIRAAS